MLLKIIMLNRQLHKEKSANHRNFYFRAEKTKELTNQHLIERDLALLYNDN